MADVSIVTIFFDARRFIAQAIHSVLSQTCRNWELLLVDDGSSDGSTEIARSYVDLYPERIRYLSHPGRENRGMSASRNLGITHAAAALVAFLDADDVWLPQKLEEQMAILDAHPAVALVYGAPMYWHGWTGRPGDALRDYVCDVGVEPEMVHSPPSLLRSMLDSTHTPCPSDIVVRRDAVTAVGGFEEQFVGPAQLFEDQAFLAKIYLRYPVFVSATCWDRYRIHDDSCDAVVTRSGRHVEAKRFFLKWLSDYLHRQGGVATDFIGTVDAALAVDESSRRENVGTPAGSDGDVWRRQWWMRTGGGGAARLSLSDDGGVSVRVDIDHPSDVPHDVQLNLPRLVIVAGREYAVTFEARADRARAAFVGCAQAFPPWANLGLYAQIQLTDAWSGHSLAFSATDAATNARIHFDLGADGSAAELRRLTLRDTASGAKLAPQLPDDAWPTSREAHGGANSDIENSPRTYRRLLDDIARVATTGSEADIRATCEIFRYIAVDADAITWVDHHVLPRRRQHKRLVATCDPLRTPGANEIVICYGDYPFMVENLAYTDHVFRHSRFFDELMHDEVECDRAWLPIAGIYVINLAERLDRWLAILGQLARVRAPLDRITRIEANKNADNPYLGCTESHLQAARHAVASGADHVLVLEDDFQFIDASSVVTAMGQFFQRNYSYDVCLLAASRQFRREPFDDLLDRSYQECTTASGYLVHGSAWGAIVPLWEEGRRRLLLAADYRWSPDRMWCPIQSRGKMFVFRKKLGFQTTGYSSIAGTVVDPMD